MLKSNYGIKIWFNESRPRPSVFKSRFLKFKFLKIKRVTSKRVTSGFLLIELMMAIFIGLVFISSLARMHSILLELQDSFYMRDKALGMAVEWLEQDDLSNNDVKSNGAKSNGLSNNMRDIRLNFDQRSVKQLDKNKLITKVKVEWQSLAGKNCCLEI